MSLDLVLNENLKMQRWKAVLLLVRAHTTQRTFSCRRTKDSDKALSRTGLDITMTSVNSAGHQHQYVLSEVSRPRNINMASGSSTDHKCLHGLQW